MTIANPGAVRGRRAALLPKERRQLAIYSLWIVTQAPLPKVRGGCWRRPDILAVSASRSRPPIIAMSNDAVAVALGQMLSRVGIQTKAETLDE